MPPPCRDVVMESVWKFERPEGGARSSGRKPVGNKTIVIGTTGEVYHDRYDKVRTGERRTSGMSRAELGGVAALVTD